MINQAGVVALAAAASVLASVTVQASETITYQYDALGRVVRSTYAGGQYFGQNVAAVDLSNWGTAGVTVQSAGLIDGEPAYQYTIPTPAWAAVFNGVPAATGETYSFAVTLKAVAGSSDQQALGLHGNTTGWGSAAMSTARIVSGPGQISQWQGGMWKVTGLSSSQLTRIEVVRTFTQTEGLEPYLYIDFPGGHRAGQSLVAGAPRLSKASANQVHQICYDAAGNRTQYVSNSVGGAVCAN